MTARTLRRLRHLALRTLRRTVLIPPHRPTARPRSACAPPCGERFLTQIPRPRTPGDR
ncbi:hypothetical protein AB0E82_32435 [Streptomyces anulatus]|uniref:hypothetical protein n=1 Tax=Streptomyces anulatus TaxID=1892 RepID=UPI003410826C